MPILTLHVDDQTLTILEHFSRDLGRTVEDLAECAIAEHANDSLRGMTSAAIARITKKG